MKSKPRINLPISKPTKSGDVEPPNWRRWLIYLGVMLLLLWLWQDVIISSAIRTIPYSEFKDYVARHEVVRAEIGPSDIYGVIVPKPAEHGVSPKAQPSGSAGNAKAQTRPQGSKPGEVGFHTVRVDDPNLVNDLQS